MYCKSCFGRSIIKQLSEKSHQFECENETITDAAKRLLEVRNPLIQATPRPDTPLSFGCLLTGTRSDPTLVSQLQKKFSMQTRLIFYAHLAWARGGYDKRELDNLLTGNDMRAMLVIKKLKEILLDVRLARGLCF